MKPILTPHDVAREYGISINTIQAWCRDNTNGFPAFRLGKHFKIHKDLLDDWFRSQARDRSAI